MTTGNPQERQGFSRCGWAWLKAWATKKPANAGTALLVVVLIISLPFGGWRPAAQDEIPQVQAGEAVTAAPFEIRILDAVYGEDLGGHLSPEGFHDARHVMVVLSLRNTSDLTLSLLDLRDSLTISGLPEPAGAGGGPEDEPGQGWSTVLDVDGPPQALSGLAPGMDYIVGLHHRTLATDEALSEVELTVSLSAKTYRQQSVSDLYRWMDPTLVATVSVPLRVSGPDEWVREVPQ